MMEMPLLGSHREEELCDRLGDFRDLVSNTFKHCKSAKLPCDITKLCSLFGLYFCPDITLIKCLKSLKSQKPLSGSKF